MKCHFGCDSRRDPPVAKVVMSRGCVVFPEDTTQILCYHHLMRGFSQGFLGEVFDVDWFLED